MREIKFRALSEFKNQIHYPSELEDLWSFLRRVHGMKLMQYTEKKDFNGKEIYEGDIVKYCSYLYKELYSLEEIEESDFKILKVEFSDNNYPRVLGWGLFDKNEEPNEYYYGGFNAEGCIVIGNIYENHELL